MVVIHHWDTDGITSAALLIKALNLENLFNLSPPIGEFRFDERIKRAVEEAERVYILDLNLPSEVEKIEKDTIFIDHHPQERIENPLVKQINPALSGEETLSTSFVISRYFDIWNSWSALGTIGDAGTKAFEIPKVRELLARENLSEKEALRLVELIDSNYISMDREGVEEAVRVMLENSARELLTYEPWIKKVEEIKNAIENAILNVEKEDNVALIEFSSPLNIISKVARKAVWEMGYDGALVINSDFHGKAQLYFRVSPRMVERIDLLKVIKELKAKGFSAGGKREVLGCICEKKGVEEALEIIRAHFGGV
jgi:single-stranded DNA-specific DHH superfamily exonuclease